MVSELGSGSAGLSVTYGSDDNSCPVCVATPPEAAKPGRKAHTQTPGLPLPTSKTLHSLSLLPFGSLQAAGDSSAN
jgi:hypothetical protein